MVTPKRFYKGLGTAGVVAVLMAFYPSTAHCDTIGGPSGIGCSGTASNNDCFGSSYTLTDRLVSSTSTTQSFRITLTVDTTTYSTLSGGTAGALLDAVALKVTDDSNVSSESFSPPPSGWAFVDGGLSAGGCSISPNGFDCLQANTLGNALGTGSVNGGVFTFAFNFKIKTGTLFTGAPGSGNAASVKALYVDSTGKQLGLTSDDIQVQGVPEPGSLPLFGVGLVGLLVMKRHFRPRK